MKAKAQKESDPHGMEASMPGAKLDAGKNKLSLTILGFSRALEAVGWVSTKGAEKYSPGGWVYVPSGIERYTDALCRHLNLEGRGERVDSDLGVLHATQVAWNALARLDLMLREEEARAYASRPEEQAHKDSSLDLDTHDGG